MWGSRWQWLDVRAQLAKTVAQCWLCYSSLLVAVLLYFSQKSQEVPFLNIESWDNFEVYFFKQPKPNPQEMKGHYNWLAGAPVHFWHTCLDTFTRRVMCRKCCKKHVTFKHQYIKKVLCFQERSFVLRGLSKSDGRGSLTKKYQMDIQHKKL